MLQDTSLFPFLRLMIPKLDAERDAYGIQTKSLGRLYVKALAINENSDDAKKLLLHDGLSGGDYADVVHNVMKRRSPQIGTLKVYDVNRYLDLMGDHFRNNERSSMSFGNFTALLNQLRNGVKQSLFYLFYRDQRRNYYNAQGNDSD